MRKLTAQQVCDVLEKSPKLRAKICRSLAHYNPFINRSAAAGRTTTKTAGDRLRELLVGNGELTRDLYNHIPWDDIAIRTLIEERTRRYLNNRFGLKLPAALPKWQQRKK